MKRLLSEDIEADTDFEAIRLCASYLDAHATRLLALTEYDDEDETDTTELRKRLKWMLGILKNDIPLDIKNATDNIHALLSRTIMQSGPNQTEATP